MWLETLAVGPLQVNCHIVACPESREACVIDPGDEGERIMTCLHRNDLRLRLVLNTHGHFDHVGANRFLVEATGASLLIHSADAGLLGRAMDHAALYGLTTSHSPPPDGELQDGDILTVGSVGLRVLHTPGHTRGGVCLLAPGHLFSGDTLFAGSVGRTDLPGGDFSQLETSIRTKLWPLPDATVVHPGHGPDTSIGRERRTNPFVGSPL